MFLLTMISSLVMAGDMKIQFFEGGSCDPNPGKCRIESQSSSIEPYECRNCPGKQRCYADVVYENGTKLRVWGGCYESMSDCWGSGSGAVSPCN